MCHAYLTVVFRNMHVQVSIQTLKDAADGACIAVLDRNDVDNEWRKVFLVRSKAEPAHFKLNNEKGELLDEPEEGCPKGIVADADKDHPIDDSGKRSKAWPCGGLRSRSRWHAS